MAEIAVLMLKSDVKIKQIQSIVDENFKDVETDVWADFDTMEVLLPSGNSIDFEQILYDDLDENDKIYCQSIQIKTMYYLNYELENLNTVLEIVKLILNIYDGFLGNDTDNFEPVYSKDKLDGFKCI